jgi:hypothetical protein
VRNAHVELVSGTGSTCMMQEAGECIYAHALARSTNQLVTVARRLAGSWSRIATLPCIIPGQSTDWLVGQTNY